MAFPTADLLDRERLAASDLIATVEYYDSLPSTQDRAHELARVGDHVRLPTLIVAEEQTAGRGRGANRWWTARGSLAFSVLFDPADWSLPREPLAQQSLAAGVAIIDCVGPVVGQRAIGLHWPNDVFVSEKKLSGVLIDLLGGGRRVVGIGLNVNNTFVGAPDEVRQRATSLHELTGRTFDRTELLLNLLARLAAAFRDSAAAPEVFGSRFQDLCLQRGRDLTVESAGQRTAGRCAGIAPDGALLLETSNGWQKIYSGVLR